MRASVHIKLPKLSKDMDAFKAITDKHFLQIRGIHGEHSQSEGGVYDISNKRRLGVTEVECVQDMVDGVKELIAKEKAL
jgi:creatine kinase/arginine kinase